MFQISPCHRLLTLFIFLFYAMSGAAQNTVGCTDPQALNYDEMAVENDGSCNYPLTVYSPELIGPLPDQVPESSGLVLYDGCLWTHNDSGWSPNLFCLDPENGDLIRETWVANAQNRDWEEITRDDDFLYIGDFGNNNGNRTDLVIYKVPLDKLSEDTAMAAAIFFDYPDQTEFDSRPLDNDFDMEAMISFGDSLYLFSKNWTDLQTRLYALPKTPGTFTARLVDSFNVNGLITGAAIRSADGLVVLVGYTPILSPFVWLLWDYRGTDFFSGHKRRIELGIPFHQVEAVCWNPGADHFYISNERFNNIVTIPARLHRMEVNQWVDDHPTYAPHTPVEKRKLHIFPNPGIETLYIELPPDPFIETEILVIHSSGLQFSQKLVSPSQKKAKIDVSQWPTGHYVISLKADDGMYTAKFIKL